MTGGQWKKKADELMHPHCQTALLGDCYDMNKKISITFPELVKNHVLSCNGQIPLGSAQKVLIIYERSQGFLGKGLSVSQEFSLGS